MLPQRNDLVICLESGHLGIVIDVLASHKFKVNFDGEIVILESEDVEILRRHCNAEVQTSEKC